MTPLLRRLRAIRRLRRIRGIRRERNLRWALSWVYDRGVVRDFDVTQIIAAPLNPLAIRSDHNPSPSA